MKCKKYMLFLLLTAFLLSGCSMHTVDKLYCLPRRSEEFAALQASIDEAMLGLEYCAPRSGENQQTVQMADLDGDGEEEYLVFAKGYSETPLRILVFDQFEEEFRLVDTIESNGLAFDMVEYAQMDRTDGMELVVGYQLSNQVLRSVSVYSFQNGKSERLLKTNYARMLTLDLDMDSFQELFVLRPGQTETDNGIAELYGIRDGTMERSNEVSMSRPADKLKRILVGRLYDGEPAVYTASSVEDKALITDVFACVDQALVNVSFSNESGTSVQTMRNYYVYSDDIDSDGVVELPDLITMQTLDGEQTGDHHDLIRWYAMRSNGTEVDKLYTYHEFIGGWYLQLNSDWAPRLTVRQEGNAYNFYLWSESFDKMEHMFTIYALSGKDRESLGDMHGRFMLLKTDSVSYAAVLEPSAIEYHMDKEGLIRDFHLIQQEWKTGET